MRIFSLCRDFVRELLASIGVPDTADYFVKELDFFDTTVCILMKILMHVQNVLLLSKVLNARAKALSC